MEVYGGAERVTAEMARAFPDAPVVAIAGRSSVAARMGIAERFRSLLPPSPSVLRHYRLLTPVYPVLACFRRLPEADVLLTSSYAFAHHLQTRNHAPQICYCHSPLRFAWSMTDSYRAEWAPSWPAARAFSLLAASLRASDRRSARRVAHFLTQSPFTADQIERFYGRRAEVIGAPIDTELFRPGRQEPDDYYLVCARLVEPYKRTSVVIDAFRHLPHRLVVAGDGPAFSRLRSMAPSNVDFVGHLEDHDLVPLMQRCLAAIFPSRDDFGLLPLEVMACGRPVLAYAEGGACHTVVPGVSGALFLEQTPEALLAAISSFSPSDYEPSRVRAHAQQWDRHQFVARLKSAVRHVGERQEQAPSGEGISGADGPGSEFATRSAVGKGQEG